MSTDKKIYKYIGFLETECGMIFMSQSFSSYRGFAGPTETYSFYNKFGCITFHYIVQRGEWGWFISNKFSTVQDELLEKEINQSEYLRKSYCFTSAWLKALQKVIKDEIAQYGTVFHIKVR